MTLADRPQRDRRQDTLDPAASASVRGLERRPRLRRHRDDPAAAGTAAVRRHQPALSAGAVRGVRRASTAVTWSARRTALIDQQWHDALATGVVAGTPLQPPSDVTLKPARQALIRRRRHSERRHAAVPPGSAYLGRSLRQQRLAAGTAAAADQADLGQSAAGFARLSPSG